MAEAAVLEQEQTAAEYDRTARRDIEAFREAADRYTRGELTDDQFRPYRLRRGVYTQRQAGVHMIRTKVPGGLLTVMQMRQLAEEIRREIIEKVSVKGGHLAPNLGVVELTMALHAVFNTPDDLLVWDIGHQAYVHKLLTGRRTQFHTIRQFGGLSGYLRREESPYDVFGASHASTSISAALGLAVVASIAGVLLGRRSAGND